MSIRRPNYRVRQQQRGILADIVEGGMQGAQFVQSIRQQQSEQEARTRLRDIQERRTSVQERQVELDERQAEAERLQQQSFQQTLSGIMDGPEQQRTLEAAEGKRQRAGGLKVLKDFGDLSQMPRSIRGPQVDTFAARFEKQTGHKLAPNVVETLKRGSEKDLTLMSRGLARMALDDQQFNQRQAVEILSNPGKSATLFTQAGKMAPVLEERDQTQQQAGETPTQEAASTGGGQSGQQQGAQPGPTRERAASQPESAPQEVSQLNQTIGRLRRLRGVQGLTSEQQSQVDRQIEQRESRRNEILLQAEGNILRATREMPDEQALSVLRGFEARLMESSAPREQIDRVRERIQEVRPDEGGRLEFTADFRRQASAMFGPDQVTNDRGEFDASNLSSEQIQQVNDRIDSDGGQVRDLPEEEVRERFPSLPEGSIVQEKPSGAIAIRHTPSDPSQREQKVESLTERFEAMGLDNPRETATDVVDGNLQVEVLDTGDVRLIDQAKAAAGEEGAVRALPTQFPQTGERAEVPSEETLFSMASDATGLRSGLMSTFARIPGVEPSDPQQAVLEARSQFNTFANDLARSLAQNERFPVKERQAIIGALDISPSVFDNPGAMRARLRAADRHLRTRLEQFERDAQDQNLATEVRQDQSANAAAMRNAIDRLGVPQAGDMVEALDSPEAVEAMSRAEVNWMIDEGIITEDEWGRLPDDVKATIDRKTR